MGTGTSLGDLLKVYRLAAGLTQEVLAERAGMSARSIQALEHGTNQPRPDTAERLATALRLAESERQRFVAAAVPTPRKRDHGFAASPRDVGAGGMPHNLPVQVTSFIGREQEMTEVIRLLGTRRLLTLTGSGGTGKTRLALQVASSLLERYPQGVWLVELAPVSDPALVALTVATALGLREEPGQPLVATLTEALRPRRLLLVLDNCEHLLDACAALAGALLHACPQVAILATSREALGITGEIAWRVPSLALPDLCALPVPETLAQVEAVQLFVERALAVRPHFLLTAQTAAAVARICRELDGIPLALELAAARLKGLSAEQLATRLDQRFRLLTGGSRTALPRQQTLEATIEWSYSLLRLAEQTLFNRLSLFAGGFTIEATEAVCAGGEVPGEEVLDLLLRLVDKSLVVADEGGGDIERYHLLETLRQYACERLLQGGDTTYLQARHTAYYCALAEESDEVLFGPQYTTWMDRLAAEHENIRQALSWALEGRVAREGLRLGGALRDFWLAGGYFGEGRRWLAALLALPEAAARTPARAKALYGQAILVFAAALHGGGWWHAATEERALLEEAVDIARATGDSKMIAEYEADLGHLIGREEYTAGRTLLQESIALCRAAGYPRTLHVYRRTMHVALIFLANVACAHGDWLAARAWCTESVKLSRQEGDQTGYAEALLCLGSLVYQEGDVAVARRHLEECLALGRSLHDRFLTAIVLGQLGMAARAQGDAARAYACVEERLALWQQRGERGAIAGALTDLGRLALQEGEPEQARGCLEEALRLRRDLGNVTEIAASLASLGDLACEQGDYQGAAALYTEGLTLLSVTGDRNSAAACLEGLAAVAWAGGDAGRAARLCGAAASLCVPDLLNPPITSAMREGTLVAARAALGDAAFAAAWAAGQVMSPQSAIADALVSHNYLGSSPSDVSWAQGAVR